MADSGTPKHGTQRSYNEGCHCEECRKANTETARRKRERAKERARRKPTGPSAPPLNPVVPILIPRTAWDESLAAELEDLKAVVRKAIALAPDDEWTRVDKSLLLRLVKEVENPSTSMSIGPIVVHVRELVMKLRKEAGEDTKDARLDGLAGIFGGR